MKKARQQTRAPKRRRTWKRRVFVASAAASLALGVFCFVEAVHNLYYRPYRYRALPWVILARQWQVLPVLEVGIDASGVMLGSGEWRKRKYFSDGSNLVESVYLTGLGFTFSAYRFISPADHPLARWNLHIPYWMLAVLLMLLPWRWMVLRKCWRREALYSRGLCGYCKYDLRASCDRCPECGRCIPSKLSTAKTEVACPSGGDGDTTIASLFGSSQSIEKQKG